MQRVTVFYSWQSDRDQQVCRYFIAEALKVAGGQLKTHDIELVVDHDTLNEPGMPEITDTILRKIETCDVFLPDLTFVAETADGKPVPNPNVALELGYALKVRGSRRILPVLNTCWGAEPLPFNIRHRRKPTCYAAEPGVGAAERRRRQEQLGRDLSEYIRLIAQELRADSGRSEKELRGALHQYWWDEGVVNRRPRDAHPIVTDPHVMVHLVPEEVIEGVDLDLVDIENARSDLELAGSMRDQSIGVWWAHGPLRPTAAGPNRVCDWASCLKASGLVEWRFNVARKFPNDSTVLVKPELLERQIVALVDRGLHFLRSVGLQGRVLVGVVLYGTDQIEVATPGSRSTRLRDTNPAFPTALIPAGAERGGDGLKPLFDGLWISAGAPLGSPSFPAGGWNGYHETGE
jgi:hypothetical protein